MGRRWGKTVLGGVLVMNTLRQHGKVAWIAPTYKNSRPLWRWASSVAAPLARAGLMTINKSERTIETNLGGMLGIFSADSIDAIRGEWFHLAVLDEAARITEEARNDAILPTLADAGGDEVDISTPRGQNWFYQEWRRGYESMSAEIAAWKAPTNANPIPQIRQAFELAFLRLPERSFRQEWLAEFLSGTGQVFQREWWNGRSRYDVSSQSIYNQVEARWISWDTALKEKQQNDYSAATVAELWSDWRLAVRRVRRGRWAFPDLPNKIVEMAQEFNSDDKLRGVIVEDKGSGTSALQTLQATAPDWLRPRLIAFAPQGDKVARANQAGVWCANGSVLMPHPCADASWLLDFESELFDFPNAEHDDMVDSFSQIVIFLEHYLAQGLSVRHAHATVVD